MYNNFSWGNLRERNHFDNFHVDGKIILGKVLKNMNVELKLVCQDQNTDKWLAHTERVRKF
jgi:hypothetical protein